MYVQGARGPALINVLVAGYSVDTLVAQRFKEATGGSEFLFVAGGRVVASTLNPRATAVLSHNLRAAAPPERVGDGVIEYAPRVRTLLDVEGHPIGELWILRSFETARQRLAGLRQNIILLWLFAIVAGLR